MNSIPPCVKYEAIISVFLLRFLLLKSLLLDLGQGQEVWFFEKQNFEQKNVNAMNIFFQYNTKTHYYDIIRKYQKLISNIDRTPATMGDL